MRLMRFAIPLALLVGLGAIAVGFVAAAPREPYRFTVDTVKQDITSQAGEVSIEPHFRGVADDRFPYEIYFNASRQGTSSDGGTRIDGFRRTENWSALATLETQEDEQEGRKDLRLALQFEQISFLIDNGRARYSGLIGPDAKFREVLPDGTRNDVTNIPGWPGINARTVENKRAAQSGAGAGSAWFSITDQGRLYNEQYFADYNDPEQRNYPGALMDPLHLALGMVPEFAKDAKLKLNQTTEVTRRLPLGAIPGATADYKVTYKLVNLYGTLAEPTAARFTFTAVPVKAQHSMTSAGMQVSFDAPEIKEGTLLYDLAKGVAADITWNYSLKGTIAESGSNLRTEFSVDAEFRASLRKKAEDKTE